MKLLLMLHVEFPFHRKLRRRKIWSMSTAPKLRLMPRFWRLVFCQLGYFVISWLIIISLKKIIQQVDEFRRKLMNDPKSLGKAGAKRRRAGTVDHCDYLTNKNYKPVKRRRTDPLITLGSCLDKVCVWKHKVWIAILTNIWSFLLFLFRYSLTFVALKNLPSFGSQ